MTDRRPLPTEDAVRAALAQFRAEADITGRRVSVLALARRLDLPNTTLRRRFPAACAEPAVQARTSTAEATAPASDAHHHKLVQDNAKLRRHNHHLTEHLELAIANIQRLTLENHQLQQALEAARNITRLPARPSARR